NLGGTSGSRVVGGIGGNATICNPNRYRTSMTLGFSQAGIIRSTNGVILISRQSNGRQNANNGNHDHQFDQCKTLLLFHYVLLELIKPKNQQLTLSMVYANSILYQGREPGYAHPTPPSVTAS